MIQAALDTLAEHHMRGKEVMDHFRDLGIADIPTREYYRMRYKTEEEYKTWLRYKFEYEDVSDERVSAMSSAERIDFYNREKNRRIFGLWVDVPSFSRLSAHEQKVLRDKNPLAGRVQVLSGTHYFMLNYLFVEDKESDVGKSRPTYYRRDAMILDIIDSLENYRLKPGEDRQWLSYQKSRGTHFSTLSYSHLINRLTIKEKYNIVSTIDSEKKITRVGQKIETLYYSQPIWAQPMKPRTKTSAAKSLFSKMAGDKQQYGLRLDEWDYELNRINKEKDSTILIRIPKPTAFEMERADLALCDEANLYPTSYCKWPIFEQKALGALIGSGNRRSGFMIAGGVSDTNNENVEHFKERWRNPKSFGCYVLFSGRQHFQQVDNMGWTPEEEIIERENERRRQIQETGDDEAYITYITQNAIKIEDCFHIKGNRIVDSELVNEQLHKTERMIASGEITLHRGWLYAQNGDPENVHFIPDRDGGWYIMEHPDEHIRNSKHLTSDYVAGSDNVDLEVTAEVAENTNEGKGKLSLQSMAIIKTATGEPVALYLYRHPIPEDDFRQKLLGLSYYRCRNLPETNKVKELDYMVMKSDYVDAGYPPGYFMKYLKPTPTRFGIANRTKTQYGINTNKNKVQLVYDYYMPYIRENLQSIRIPILLRDIADWQYVQGGKSPDSTMALLLASVHLADVTRYEEKRIAANNRKKGPGNYGAVNKPPRMRYINGKLKWG